MEYLALRNSIIMCGDYEVITINSISKISRNDWDNIVNVNNLFFAYDFLLCLEKSGCTSYETGWVPNHILIQKKNEIVAIIPNFIKYHSAGEYVFDQNWASVYLNLGLNYYPKYLSAVPFTPINGDRIFYTESVKKFIDIFNPIVEFLNNQDISSHHFNFISKIQSNDIAKSGLLTRLGIQYHWYNNNYSSFYDYLDSFKMKKKKNVLKERNFLFDKGIFFKIKSGNQIKVDDLNFFYSCYQNTIEKKWANKYLNFDFFKNLLNTSLKNNIILFIAYEKDGKEIASALNFKNQDVLYGRYWGCVKNLKYLHFELCYYQSIDYAIKNKLRMIESGAQGEHKIPRGYQPTITFSNHWIKNKKIHQALEKVLRHENQNVIDTANYLSKLLPFRNQI